MGNIQFFILLVVISFIYAVFPHSSTPAVKATPSPNTCVGVDCTYCGFTTINVIFPASGDKEIQNSWLFHCRTGLKGQWCECWIVKLVWLQTACYTEIIYLIVHKYICQPKKKHGSKRKLCLWEAILSVVVLQDKRPTFGKLADVLQNTRKLHKFASW